MLEIFEKYENLRFVKIKPGTKQPIGQGWQNSPLTLDEIKEFTKKNTNYGIVTGFGDLIIIDCDKVKSTKPVNPNEDPIRFPELDEKLQEVIENNLPNTFVVKSGSGARHYYFFCRDLKSKVILKSKYKEQEVHWGEILSNGSQAIGPGSIHPDTGNTYVILKQTPIAEVSKMQLYSALNDFIPSLNQKEDIPLQNKEEEPIDNLSITDIFSISALKKHNNEYYGSHPIHGSTNGMNFWLNPSKNTWFCFRCDSGGGPAKAIAVTEGICDCSDTLHGEKFKEVIKVAKEKYNLKEKYVDKEEKEKPKESIIENTDITERSLYPYNFNDFMAKDDKKTYYVKNMFASSTINMIFSPPKQMKSFVSYYLALCISQGKDFFNQKTKKVNVAYFDWENPIGDVQNRINGICEGMGFEKEEIDNLYFFPKQHTLMRVDRWDSFVYEDLRDQLFEFIQENNIKVLFFDTFRRLGNFDENDSKTINTIKSELFDPLISETNVCIIFLHHTSKEGKTYRGSVDIEGILDTSFKVTKQEKEETIDLKISCDAKRNNEIDFISSSVDIETDSYEDEDGDMYEEITSVKFSRNEEVEEENSIELNYKAYRDHFINELLPGVYYRNKDLSEMLKYHFHIKSPKTVSDILKWLSTTIKPKVLLKSGQNKGTRYQINPELKENVKVTDIGDKDNLDLIEDYLHQEFKKYDSLSLENLKDNIFSEQNLSLVIDKWNKRGWINTAKKGYLEITHLYRGEINAN